MVSSEDRHTVPVELDLYPLRRSRPSFSSVASSASPSLNRLGKSKTRLTNSRSTTRPFLNLSGLFSDPLTSPGSSGISLFNNSRSQKDTDTGTDMDGCRLLLNPFQPALDSDLIFNGFGAPGFSDIASKFLPWAEESPLPTKKRTGSCDARLSRTDGPFFIEDDGHICIDRENSVNSVETIDAEEDCSEIIDLESPCYVKSAFSSHGCDNKLSKHDKAQCSLPKKVKEKDREKCIPISIDLSAETKDKSLETASPCIRPSESCALPKTYKAKENPIQVRRDLKPLSNVMTMSDLWSRDIAFSADKRSSSQSKSNVREIPVIVLDSSGPEVKRPKESKSMQSDSSYLSNTPSCAQKDVTAPPNYPIYDFLTKKLSNEGRQIDFIRGDGNCFFRALSKHLYGTEQYHKAVRSLIIDLIATHKSRFAQFIDREDVQSHVETMSEDRSWATTCEVYAAATLLQRDIYMLTPAPSGHPYHWLYFKPVFPMEPQCRSTNQEAARDSVCNQTCYITLCNTNGNHYDRVVATHGGCNCFLPCPELDGINCNVDLTSS